MIIGGDFNVRVVTEGGSGWNEEESWKRERKSRKSKDEVTNKNGRRLISFIEERGWSVCNGCRGG